MSFYLRNDEKRWLELCGNAWPKRLPCIRKREQELLELIFDGVHPNITCNEHSSHDVKKNMTGMEMLLREQVRVYKQKGRLSYHVCASLSNVLHYLITMGATIPKSVPIPDYPCDSVLEWIEMLHVPLSDLQQHPNLLKFMTQKTFFMISCACTFDSNSVWYRFARHKLFDRHLLALIRSYC